ncbi:MAG: RecX family transcriptional regulator, partial [Chlorobiales bacterium]|nr:RecX family transcriptional regulator [Chlorobiales bacterium]
EEVIEDALRNYDAPGMCLAAEEKKMRSLSGTPETKQKKLITFLRNRGFDWSTIRETVEKLTGDGNLSL